MGGILNYYFTNKNNNFDMYQIETLPLPYLHVKILSFLQKILVNLTH